MSSRLTFFSAPSVPESSKKWLAAGSIFRAMAVAYTGMVFWDIRTPPSLAKILTLYSQQYPDALLLAKVDTPGSQFKHLFNTIPDFLNQLAYVFFQLVLQGGLQQTLTQAHQLLLLPGEFNDAYFMETNALPILAQQLGIQIYRYESENEKVLPSRQLITFSDSSNNTTINAQIWRQQPRQYHVLVQDPSSYQAGLIMPELEYKDDVNVALLISHFKKLSHHLEEKYQNMESHLLAWSKLGDLKMSELKSLYQKFSTSPQHQHSPIPNFSLQENAFISHLARLATFYPEVKAQINDHIENPPTHHFSTMTMR